ncbi:MULTISPECIES: hypothetical protein [Brevibacillus]|uniref:hypothetical protein n=1 Tax=Brevibacillus TaxID=55080 RepID=UPI002041DABE|nr:hypothetical protein [Brevibacillus borstelensis]MCM3594037.1 hypothetical protein [Brevibacillus borstelensis]
MGWYFKNSEILEKMCPQTIVDQIKGFVQERGALIALLLFILLFMADDLFPRIFGFIAQIESLYSGFELYVLTKEQELIDRYEFLAARIQYGFKLFGGKIAWVWLVTLMYRYLRRRIKKV